MLYFLTISGYLSILNPPKKSCVYMVISKKILRNPYDFVVSLGGALCPAAQEETGLRDLGIEVRCERW